MGGDKKRAWASIFLQCPQFKYILCRAHKSSARRLNRYMMSTDVKINIWWLKSLVQVHLKWIQFKPILCNTRYVTCHLNASSPLSEKRPGLRKDGSTENLFLLPVSPLGHGAAVRPTSEGLWLWPTVHCGGKDDSRATHACSDCSLH